MNDVLLYRHYLPSDKDFIYSTILKGLYYGNDYKRTIPSHIFFSNYQKILHNLFDKGVEVLVICLREDPRVILSFCIYKENRIFWVYTKIAWRNMGLAKSIVPKTIDTTVHTSKIGKIILNKHPEVIYNPFF